MLLRLGIQPDMPGASSIPVATVGANPLPPAGGPGGPVATASPPTRKVKLSSVLDPTLDAEIIQLDPTEIAGMYTDYKARFGDHPSSDIEPTADQLAALAQLLNRRHPLMFTFPFGGLTD